MRKANNTYADFCSLNSRTSTILLSVQWLSDSGLVADLNIAATTASLGVHAERESALRER